MREVEWRLDAITKRRTEDMEMQASLHGLKVSGGNGTGESAKIDDDAKAVFDKLLEEKNNGRSKS